MISRVSSSGGAISVGDSTGGETGTGPARQRQTDRRRRYTVGNAADVGNNTTLGGQSS